MDLLPLSRIIDEGISCHLGLFTFNPHRQKLAGPLVSVALSTSSEIGNSQQFETCKLEATRFFSWLLIQSIRGRKFYVPPWSRDVMHITNRGLTFYRLPFGERSDGRERTGFLFPCAGMRQSGRADILEELNDSLYSWPLLSSPGMWRIVVV